jgi:hypothetical protein
MPGPDSGACIRGRAGTPGRKPPPRTQQSLHNSHYGTFAPETPEAGGAGSGASSMPSRGVQRHRARGVGPGGRAFPSASPHRPTCPVRTGRHAVADPLVLLSPPDMGNGHRHGTFQGCPDTRLEACHLGRTGAMMAGRHAGRRLAGHATGRACAPGIGNAFAAAFGDKACGRQSPTPRPMSQATAGATPNRRLLPLAGPFPDPSPP